MKAGIFGIGIAVGLLLCLLHIFYRTTRSPLSIDLHIHIAAGVDHFRSECFAVDRCRVVNVSWGVMNVVVGVRDRFLQCLAIVLGGQPRSGHNQKCECEAGNEGKDCRSRRFQELRSSWRWYAFRI